jgi:UDP-galactopyranose mutase
MYDFLIVGAGFAGTVVAERLASQAHKKILLIDRRNHMLATHMIIMTNMAY